MTACWSRRMPWAKECRAGLVAGPDGGEPVFEGEQALPAGHYGGEAAHVAFVPIAQRAIRQSLAAPVEDGDSEPPCAEVAHGLEIFFDPLRTTRKNANRAPPARGRRKPRKAQPYTVRCLEHARYGVVGNGIGGDGDELH